MALEVGTPAPSMRFRDGNGRVYTNEDFSGKSHLVLAFYSNAFTSG
jgi:peroxiredoxin